MINNAGCNGRSNSPFHPNAKCDSINRREITGSRGNVETEYCFLAVIARRMLSVANERFFNAAQKAFEHYNQGLIEKLCKQTAKKTYKILDFRAIIRSD